jgi:hypothetical protein
MPIAEHTFLIGRLASRFALDGLISVLLPLVQRCWAMKRRELPHDIRRSNFAGYCFGAGGGYRLFPRLTGLTSPRWQVQHVTI